MPQSPSKFVPRTVRTKIRSSRGARQRLDKGCDELEPLENCKDKKEVPSGTSTPRRQYSAADTSSVVDSVSKILHDVGLGPDGNHAQNMDSDEFFRISPNTKSAGNLTGCIDAAFDELGDVYANYSARKGLTPRTAYSGVNSSLIDTPQCFASPDYVPSEIRLARRQAMLEGQNDAKEVLRKCGMNFENFIYNIFSVKKSTKKNFLCSTPKADNSNTTLTPVNTCRRNTPLLSLSGVQKLGRTPGDDSSPICVSPITPLCRTNNTPAAATPFNWSSISPLRTLPTEVKGTLLADFVCYVDVKTDKIDMTETIGGELLALGATVEKNFTKKVTIVVFKEGRVSTYLKAKKANIPLVSVLWIEDCKRAGTVLDPRKYRPMKMDKYDDILPFETLKKRRLPKLRTIGKHVNLEGTNNYLTRTNQNKISRKAVTEGKISAWNNNDKKERNCNKKLEFGSEANVPMNDAAIPEDKNVEDSVNISNEKHGFSPTKVDTPVRSSPRLSEKRKQRSYTEDGKASNCGIRILGKRRKLFNPEITYLSQPLPEQGGTPPSGSSASTVYPYLEDDRKTAKLRGVRTRLSAGRMRNKKTLTGPSKPKQQLTCLNEQEEIDSFRSCSRRSSLSFVSLKKKEVSPNKKNTPTIVFTRIPAGQLKEVESIVKELGTFEIEQSVTRRTTHLVASEPKRTLNMVKGIVRGCWILNVDWILKSKAAGKWLNEEQYEMSSFSPAVVHCRLERQAFGRDFSMDLFSTCGGVYISQNTKPPWKELESLVKLCGGRVVSQARAATIVVRGECQSSSRSSLINGESSDVIVVNEKWILDSITQNTALDTAGYTLNGLPKPDVT